MTKFRMAQAVGLLIAVLCCLGAVAETEPFRKKAIACSWDLGNFSFADILSNKAAFAAMPFGFFTVNGPVPRPPPL